MKINSSRQGIRPFTLLLVLAAFLVLVSSPSWSLDKPDQETETLETEESAPDSEPASEDETQEKEQVKPARRPPAPPKVKPPLDVPPRKGQVSLFFKDVDIRVLIQFMAKLTGKNYVVSDKVSGRVSIVAPKPVSVEEAMTIFESVLEVNDFTTIKSGDVIKVVPVREARRAGVAMLPPHQRPPPGSEAMVTQMVTLKHASAQDLRAILVPLASRYAYITAHQATNSLILTDVASNVRRLTQIIEELDLPGSQNLVEVVPLTYASANEMAKALQELFRQPTVQRRKGQAVRSLSEEGLKVLSDERTNSLILLGDRGDIDKALRLISRLDLPEPAGSFNIHVLYLKYAVADELSQVLSNLAGGQAPKTTDKDKKTQVPKEERLKVLSGEVKIVADPATNSLIVSATPQEFKVIQAIVAKLDIPRTMVYVEAVILEMTTDKSLEFGIQWSAGEEGFAGFGSQVSSDVSDVLAPGLSFGTVGTAIKFGEFIIPDLRALVRAVQGDTDIRVVATPQILTADNEEATIQVAQNMPFVTRVDQGTSETDRAIQVFEYRDVGYTLKVTPRISENRIVRLGVEAEAKAVVKAQTTDTEGRSLLAPTTTVRQAKTVILSRDQEIVVIGGLIGNEMEESGTQVPCLGTLPVIGWGFKSTTSKGKRTNLLIFLSPHILASQEEIQALSERKKEESLKDRPKPREDWLAPYRPKLPEPDIFRLKKPNESP